MKFFKRLGSLMLAALMLVAFQIPAPAAMTGTLPASTDKAAVTINGLSKGDSVTFYQIVKAKYDTDKGFTGFEAVKDSTIELFDKDGKAIYPSAEQIAALSTDTAIINPTDKTMKVGPVTAGDNGTVSQELAAGEWMALVTAADGTKTIYNPMVLSVYYADKDGKIVINDGSINAGDSYTINGTTSYVKKSTIPGKKEITGNSKNDVANKKGDDHAVGDTVNFEITSMVPSYGPEYKDGTVFYNISDKMDAGLTYQKDAKVYIGGSTEALAAENYTLTNNADGFKIEFTEAYIRSLATKTDAEGKVTATTDAERAVVVKYSAKINENATVNFDSNDNTMTVNFANNLNEKDGGEEITDKTHHYTFEIDGRINGSQTVNNRKTHEIIKVNEKGEPVGEPEWVVDEAGTTETKIDNGLAGATFTLTLKKDGKGNDVANGKTYEATTDGNGYFNGFTGLDAGTYELVETVAPKGYSLNTQKHTVVITAKYNDDGTLQSYEIKIDGQNTSHYTATYNADKEITKIEVGTPVTTYIKNTKLNELPSTGSIGTYLFTAIGVAATAAAIGLVLADKRRKNGVR